jgi:uncharacterized protein (DUF58 family)
MNTLLFLLLGATVVADPLTTDRNVIELGEVRANKPLSQTFRLKNKGQVPLTLTEVVGTCACVRKELNRKQLAPGESAELTIGINLLVQPEGLGNWPITVRYHASNAEVSHELTLAIRATVKKEVTIEPNSLLLSAEREINGSLTIIDRRGKPLTITRVRLSRPDFEGQALPPRDHEGKRSQVIELKVAESCPVGQYLEEVFLETDDPEYRELRIPFRVIKKGPATGLEVVPERPRIRFADDQSIASTLIRLRAGEEKTVEIKTVSCDHAAIKCAWNTGNGKLATLRVTIDRNKAVASGEAIVEVKTVGTHAETVLVPVSWTIP